jgi:flagellar hook-associated protein 3 FlgL
VTSGNYTAGSSIAFNGVQVAIDGVPASGDSFTIAPAGTKDIFKALDDLAAGLETAGTSASSRSLAGTAVAAGLTQIDQTLDNVLNNRAVVGIRLGTIDNAQATREQQSDDLTVSIGKLRDVDYAEAIARMNQQLTSLQAAQAAYSRIAQLSLFNYL